MDITSFDTVIVAIGQDFENNVLTTVALKSLGVQKVVCKALTERQQAVLLKVGADRVILPEHEAGQRLAHSLTAPLLLEQLAVGTQHSVIEFPDAAQFRRPDPSRGTELRARWGVTLMAVKRGDDVIVAPPTDFVFDKERHPHRHRHERTDRRTRGGLVDGMADIRPATTGPALCSPRR